MPLLARTTLGLSLLLGTGCFSEPVPGGSGATDGTGGENETSASSGADDTDDTGDPSGGGCMGCIDAAGGCLAGNLDAACGALAVECVACEADSFCDQGFCTPLPLCNADNCDGCCDGDDCLPGGALSACGDDGSQCEICSGDSTCTDGSCRLPCDSTCTGCCDPSGTCIELDSISSGACGSRGESCVACETGFSCAGGSCISTACQGTCDGCCEGARCNDGDSNAACGFDGLSCQACPAGTSCQDICAPNPDALWQVLISSATTALTDSDGVSWDFTGFADVYVEVTIAGELEATMTVSDSPSPVWDQLLFDGVPTEDVAAGITFDFWDEDAGLNPDDPMGACVLMPTPDEFGVPRSLQCVDSNRNELWTLTLTILAVE